MVLYNGETAWNKALEFAELMELEPDILQPLMQSVPRLRLVLDDLSRKEDAELSARSREALVQLALLLLKHSRRKDFPNRLRTYSRLVREVFFALNGREALNAVASYISLASEVVQPETMSALLTQAIGREQGASAMTTFGERLIEQGIEKGLERGLERGRAEGVLLGLQQALLRTLQVRFGDVPTTLEQQILTSSRTRIDQWFGKALHASALDDVFKSPA